MNTKSTEGIGHKRAKFYPLIAITILLILVACPNPSCPETGGDTSFLWHIETVDADEAGRVGLMSSLELDNLGLPHIAYQRGNGADLKHARWNGTNWSIETIDTAGDTGNWLSLAIDSWNHPHISYIRYDIYELKYSHWNGTAWKHQNGRHPSVWIPLTDLISVITIQIIKEYTMPATMGIPGHSIR